MATRHPAYSKPPAAQQPMALKRVPDVLRAARDEATGRWQQRADQQLIPSHELCGQTPRAHVRAAARREAWLSVSANRRMSSTSSGKGRVPALGRAMMIAAISPGICARIWR